MKQKLILIKIGGNIIDSPLILDSFLEDFSKIEGKKILVHGGGKEATRLAGKLGIESTMIEGRRVTNQEMLDVAIMTYAGLINKKIIAKLQNYGLQSIGLTGADGNSIVSKKREILPIDYGFVGDVVTVNGEWITSLLNTQVTPVFCAITHNQKGQLLNTNADTIAQALATELSSFFDISLIYCFEKKGVLLDLENENSVIEKLNYTDYLQFKEEKKIHSGMLPKLDNCFKALQEGVKEIHIANASIVTNINTLHTQILM